MYPTKINRSSMNSSDIAKHLTHFAFPAREQLRFFLDADRRYSAVFFVGHRYELHVALLGFVDQIAVHSSPMSLDLTLIRPAT